MNNMDNEILREHSDIPATPAIKIGNWNNLRVEKRIDFGLYLDGKDVDNITKDIDENISGW